MVLRRHNEILGKIKLPLFIILICISLLELCIILYSILTKDLATVPWEAKNFFSFITAIICSILASAVMLLLPNTNSNNSVKDLDRIVKEILKNLSDERFPVIIRIKSYVPMKNCIRKCVVVL